VRLAAASGFISAARKHHIVSIRMDHIGCLPALYPRRHTSTLPLDAGSDSPSGRRMALTN
jgi:hypothetical protein